MKKYLAEMVGTMVLVLMGCGVAVSLGCDPVNNIPAVVGTAFAFGLAPLCCDGASCCAEAASCC